MIREEIDQFIPSRKKVNVLNFAFYTQSGKFPHLMASVPGSKETSKLTSDGEVELNFGEVPVQTSASKWIELHNVSPVSTVLNSVICCCHFPCAMHVFS